MTNASGTNDKNDSISEGFMADDTESADFEGGEEAVPPARVNPKDPQIRRKIEERLERKRLRDELGIYDDDAWEDL